MTTTCGGCASSWTGAKIAHCSGCHQTFSTINSFDRHRLRFKCADPADRGLVFNGRYWTYPPRDAG